MASHPNKDASVGENVWQQTVDTFCQHCNVYVILKPYLSSHEGYSAYTYSTTVSYTTEISRLQSCTQFYWCEHVSRVF